jgi:hypothetical protein
MIAEDIRAEYKNANEKLPCFLSQLISFSLACDLFFFASLREIGLSEAKHQ